ncbi:MAG: glycosyltransferase [Candidatus Poribacteria bacterium]|nr:glycosyltransferase [Candidatus Poribacteria bacterium]
MISIIIPTYNRKDELEDLLPSLRRQKSTVLFEIIVVDDGSTDGTRELLKNLAEDWKGRLRFLEQNRAGPGAARNLGIKHANGDILVFVDSDCIAPSEWLTKLTSGFDNPQVGAVGGPELAPPNDCLLRKCQSYVMTAFLTTGGLRGRKGNKLGVYYPRSFNMAVRKRSIEVVGGFPKRLYGEDILVGFKVKQMGYTLEFAPDAAIYHHRRATLSQYFMQLYRMGKARVELACLHKSLLELIYVLPALMLLFSMILGCGSFFSETLFEISAGGIIIALTFLTTIGIHSAIRLKTLKAFGIVPFLFILQQTAYGLGTIVAALRRQA